MLDLDVTNLIEVGSERGWLNIEPGADHLTLLRVVDAFLPFSLRYFIHTKPRDKP